MITEYELPIVPSIGEYDFDSSVAGTSYNFAFRWNSRYKAWHMSIAAADLTPIIGPTTVVLGCFMGRRSHHPLFSNGVFVAQDLSRQSRDATYDDFGTRVIVKYIPVLDVLRRLTVIGLPNATS